MALLRLGSTGPLLKNDTGLIDNSVTFAPGAVTTIAGSVTFSTIQFSWTAPVGQPPFTYTPQYKLHTDPTFISLPTTSSLTATATGLVASAQYDVRTIATNPYGSSTNNIIATVATAPIGGAAPTAPSNLFLTMGQSVANVSFTVSTGTAPISYVVYDRVSGSSAQFATAGAGTTGSIAVTGLTPGVTYDFQVVATNQYGSATSQIVTGTTNSGSIVQPGTVTLTANNVTTTTADITWTTPTGTAPFRYVLEYKTQAASLYTTLAQQTTIGASITGLLPNTAYDLRLSTTNNAGASSSPGTFTTAVAATPPGGLTVTLVSATSSQVVVQWATPSGTTPFTYTPSYRPTNAGAYTAIATTTGLQTTFSGLAAGVIYDFKVDVSGPGGNNTSNVLTTQTVPAGVAPSTVAITLGQTNDTSVNISWTAPTSGTTPFTYFPQFKLHSATQYTASGSGTSVTNYTFQNLTPATQYDFTVYIQNSAGTTVNSQPVTQTTTGGTAPSAVTVTLGTLGYNYANLSWTAASGVGSITYTPQYRVVGTSVWQSVVPATSAVSTTIVGLAPLTNYQFQVLSIIGTNSTASTNAPSGSTTAQPAVAGPITDIVFTQFQPVYSNMANQDGAGAPSIGGFEPVGGIGPYFYEVIAPNPVGYNLNGPYYSGHDRGLITTPYGPGSLAFTGTQITDTVRVRITDGKKRAFEKDVHINRLQAPSGPVLYAGGPYTYNSALRFDEIRIIPSMIGSTVGTGTLSTTSDPSGIWGEFYGSIVPLHPAQAPAPGSYPLTIKSTSSEGAFSCNITAVITTATIGTIEFVPGSISSAAPVGTTVGFAYCTTPGNLPVFSLSNNAGGKYSINGATGEVQVLSALTNTTDQITIVCTDHLSTSKQFAIPVALGSILPPTNMSFAASTTLTNSAVSQTIGTANVTGITGTKVWSVTDFTYSNPSSRGGYFGAIDPLTIGSDGVLKQATALPDIQVGASAPLPPILLSAMTYSVTILCTDGTNSCTQTFNFTVHEPATTTTYYVGRGMSTLHPGFGFEHFSNFALLTNGLHTDKQLVYVYADSDPEYYTNDFNPSGVYPDWVTLGPPGSHGTWGGFVGPIRIEGVAANGQVMPRWGGPSDGLHGSNGNNYSGQKAPFVISSGDFEIVNMEISGLHDEGDPTHGYEPLYKESPYGNVFVQNCVFRDNDSGPHTASTFGSFVMDHCEFTQNSSSTLIGGSGNTHHIYMGGVAFVQFSNNVSRVGCTGHLFKCRAQRSEVFNNRFWEGTTGSSGHCINFPDGGDHWVHNNLIVKGVMHQNPDLCRYGEDPWTYNIPFGFNTNRLLIENNVLCVISPTGINHPGGGNPANVLGYFSNVNTLGTRSTATIQNNQIYLYGTSAISVTTDTVSRTGPITSGPLLPTITGNTTLTIPPAFDMTRPFLSGNLPALHNMWSHSDYADDSYDNPGFSGDGTNNGFQGVYQYTPTLDQIRVAHTAATGTTLCTINVTTDGLSLRNGQAQHFGAGTTWIIDQRNTLYYAYVTPNPWAPAGRYSITANSDGTATVKVAGALPSNPQVDLINVLATGPTGVISRQYYYIVVT